MVHIKVNISEETAEEYKVQSKGRIKQTVQLSYRTWKDFLIFAELQSLIVNKDL